MLRSGKMIIAGVLGLGFVGTAGAASPQDPSTGGQINRCWGEVASGIAQFDSPNVTDEDHGGGMGMHSRSGTAAENNGGFASTGIIQQPRAGVGNVSDGPPHNTHPGDGGNGQHAVNNGEVFSTQLDPVTSTPMNGTGEPIECSQDVEQNVVP